MGCIISIYDTLSNKTGTIKRKLTLTLNKLSTTNMSLDEIVKDFSTFLSKVINTQLKEQLKMGDQINSDLPLAAVTEYNFNNSSEILTEIFQEWKDNLKKVNSEISGEIQNLLWEGLETAFFNTKEEIQTIIQNFTIDVNPIVNGKPLIDFSNISDLLNNSDALLNYLNTKLGQIVGATSFLNSGHYDWNYTIGLLGPELTPPSVSFVTNSLGLNLNLIAIKQSLWATIVHSIDRNVKSHPLYIKDETSQSWKINEELFKLKANGKSDYVDIVETLLEKYRSLKIKQLISSGKYSTVKSYVNLLLLLNLDAFIKSNYGDIVQVNVDSFNTWGLPRNGEPKYTLLQTSATTTTWTPDTSGATDIDQVSSSIFKILSYSIPFVSVDENKSTVATIGLYLDTVRINTAAAVLKGLPNSILLRHSKNNKSYSVYGWFEQLELNRATFKEFLEAILETRDSNLEAVRDFIGSIYKYLYDPQTGIHDLYLETRRYIPNLINPEAILWHQFRNTRKATYYFIERNNKRRSRLIDTLLLDTKVGTDFDQLYSSLQSSWITKPKTMQDHLFWKTPTFNNFITFLQDFTKLEFSPRTLTKYKKNLPSAIIGNVELSKTTVDNLRNYFLNKVKVLRQKEVDGIPTSMEESVLNSEEWIERMSRNFSNSEDPETSILFTDLDLKELFKAKHTTEVFNTVVQISNREGEKYPSLAVVNLASDFQQIIYNYTKTSQNSTLVKLTEAMEDFTILLEAGTEEIAKPVRSLSAEDNLSISIFDMFYGQILNQNKILIQPYNYADKSKILAQVIDYQKLTEGEIDKFDSTLAKKKLSDINKVYYAGLKTKILTDYGKIFGRKFNNLNEVDTFITGKTWSNILAAVEAYNKDKSDKIVFVRELHYGLYKNKVAFPKLLKFQIETWTGNKAKQEDFFKQKELEFAQSLQNVNAKFYDIRQIEYFKGLHKLGKPYKILALLKEKFGFTDEDFEITYIEEKDDNGKKIPGSIAYTQEGVAKIDKVYFKRPTILNDIAEISEPLKRFLWIRNLIMTADSIMSVKDASQHPIKSALEFDSNKTLTAKDLIYEENERSIAFYKRMVIMGGSIMRFNQGMHNGIPKEIPIACIEDPKKSTFTPSGVRENHKIADGEILVSPFGTHNFQQASPGFNYSRVLKPLGLSINKYHTSMLKCAFMGINNEMIRNSIDGEYSLEEIMRKMHSIEFHTPFFNPTRFNSDVFLSTQLPKLLENHYFLKNDQIVRILNVKLVENEPHKYDILYDNGTTSFVETNVEVKNYYQLWKLFGGAWSITKKHNRFIPNENSINLINYLVDNFTNYNINFKSDLVYLLVPEQGIKNGMMNTNPITRMTKTDTTDLSIVMFNTDYLGIQQDSSYDADESTTSEATQVLSALSENNTNPDYYNAVYETMGRVITESLEKFKELNTRQVNNITSIFLRSLSRSTTVNNARTLLDNLEEDLKDKIPFSDRTLFKQFISSVMANINKEFIKKKITGASMILNSADNMIQIYEDSIGKTYLATDLIMLYLSNAAQNKIPDAILSNISSISDDLTRRRAQIQYILSGPTFAAKQYKSIDAIQPLDTVEIRDENGITVGEPVSLIEIEDYYDFLKKHKNSNFKFFKIHGRARDLNPEKKSFSFIQQDEVTFKTSLETFLSLGSPTTTVDKTLGISNVLIEEIKQQFIIPRLNPEELLTLDINSFTAYYINTSAQHKTTFSSDAVKHKYELVFIKDSKPQPGEQLNEWELKWKQITENPFLNDFHTYLMTHNSRYNLLQSDPEVLYDTKFKILEKYLERFSNRTFLLLGDGFTFKAYNQTPNYFESVLQFQDNSFDDLDYGLDIFNPYKNLIKVFNYKHTDQEVILSNPYITQFKISDLPQSKITASTFSNWYNSSTNKKVYRYYDILLNNPYDDTKSMQLVLRKPMQLTDYLKTSAWTKDVFLLDENENLVVTTEVKGETTFVGSKVHLTTNVKFRKDDSKSVMRLDSSGAEMYQLDLFNFGTEIDPIYYFFKTSDGKEIAFTNKEQATDNLGKFIFKNWKRFGIIDIKDSKRINNKIYESIIEKCEDYRLRSYLRKRLDKFIEFNKTQDKDKHLQIQLDIQKIKDSFSKMYGSQIFNSYKLSKIALGTRIPAQSGQSYTSVKTVGYMHNKENSVYISRWQTFIQGSDFDIDKLYMMMFSIRNGLFQGWSPYFDLSTSSTVKDSLELPIPNKLKYKYTKEVLPDNQGVLDLDLIFPELNTNLNSDNENIRFPNLTISDRVRILKYIEKYWDPAKHTHVKSQNEAIFTTIRNHNSYYSEDGFNNFRVYQMVKTSRSAKNELSFNSPVSFGDYRKLTKEKETKVSIYNPMSMLIQQENNYIGRDVIGITATGLKGYFALVTYFSKYYVTGQIDPTDPQVFLREYTVGNTTKVVSRIAGLNLSKRAITVLQTALTKSLVGKYQKATLPGEEASFYSAEEIFEYINSIDDSDNPALKLSALLSAATDNAKELLLADINAGLDFAGMHIFLIMMGFNEIEIAEYMTNPAILKFKSLIRGSFINATGDRINVDTLTTKDFPNADLNILSELEKVKKENKPIIKILFENKNLSEFFKQVHSNNAEKLHFMDFILSFSSKDEFISTLRSRLESELNQILPKQLTTTQLLKLDDISQFLLDNAEQLTFIDNFQDKFTLYQKQLDQQQIFLDNFKRIYKHSSELISIGTELSINQGIKATIDEVYKSVQNVNNIMANQQAEFLKPFPESGIKSKTITNLLSLGKALQIWSFLDDSVQDMWKNVYFGFFNKELNVTNLISANKEITLVLTNILKENVKKDKPYLSDEYISKTLQNVVEENLIINGIDHEKFIDVENTTYQNIVKNYFNLIKYNFNIIDLLDNLPHFKAMKTAFRYGNKILTDEMIGYKFLHTVVPKLIDIMTYNKEITLYSTMKLVRARGREYSHVSLDPSIIERSQDLFYELMLLNWLKTLPYKLDFTDLIKSVYANSSSYKIITSDKNSAELINVDINSPTDESFIVDLKTDYGLAKFKYIMEVYIIPYLKDAYNNEFFQDYIYKSGLSFNMRRTIKFYQTGSNFDITYGIEKAMEKLVKDFGNKFQLPVKRHSNDGKLASIPIIDLLYIYDKMVNLGRYGGNRATIFFDRNRGNSTSAASAFRRYQSFVENSPEFIKNILESISPKLLHSNLNPIDRERLLNQSKAIRQAFYLTLFGYSYKGIKQYIEAIPNPKDESYEGDGAPITRKLINPYFTLISSLSNVEVSNSVIENKNELINHTAMQILNSNGIIALTNCK